jgi:DeoR family transcriptional regulator, aga operon transcriptional repressor
VQRRQRLNQIVSAVVEQGVADVGGLAEMFGVSAATIRRDLETLEEQKLVTRTHGGARPHEAFNDLPLGYKTSHNLAEKRAIAHAALDRVRDARVIGMTGGTTVTEFARLLGGTGLAVTVVTNALNIAIELVQSTSVRVFAAGGEVRSSSQEAVGPSAESFLANYNIDVAMIGVDGVDPVAGCTNYDPVGARVNGVLCERARVVVVLVDSTKIGKVALAPVSAIADVDVLITDSGASPESIEQLRERGCEVVVVSAEGAAA